MPFRLEIALDAKDSKFLWMRTVHSFLGVSDSFKITFRHGDFNENSKSEVIFSVINKSRTSLMTTRFTSEFFKVFKVDGELPGRPAEKDEENRAPSYSIWVNTKEMNVLFKDCGEDAESWKIILICGDEVVQQVYSNKMFVEFKTRANITKKYSVNYQQGYSSFDIEFRHNYYKTLKDQNQNINAEWKSRVHRLAINPIILKNFLNMFPSTLEDFKIQVFPNKRVVHLMGFNRNELFSTSNHKDKPMTLKIVMNLDDIIFSNVTSSKIQNEDYSFSVSFKLKDYKAFIQLISLNLNKFADGSTLNVSGGENNRNRQGFFDTNHNKPVIDMTFTTPGEPIVFERCYFLDRENEMTECCRVNLIEVTDSEGPKMILESTKETYVDHMRVSPLTAPSNEEEKEEKEIGVNHEPLFVPSQDDDGIEEVGSITVPTSAFYSLPQKRKLMEIAEDTDFEDGEEEREDDDPYLGPTQGAESIVKGIFD